MLFLNTSVSPTNFCSIDFSTIILFLTIIIWSRYNTPNGQHWTEWTQVSPDEEENSYFAGFLPRRPGFEFSEVMWNLWRLKWRWGNFSPATLSYPANSHSTDYSTLTIICHLGLVQLVSQWPTHQVDSLSPHPKKLK
jgi:hypothetical protein